jgi:hypothetical protein
VVAGALVSTSLIVVPLETTKASTSTVTSVVTTTLPQVTSTSTSTSTDYSTTTATLPQVRVTNTLILPPTTETSTEYSTTTVTTTITVTANNSTPPACGNVSLQGALPQSSESHAAGSSDAGAPVTLSDPAPVMIGTSSDRSATNSSSERKTVIAAGLIWVFYTDGCNIVYQTSADGGNTWSSPPTIAQTGISRGWFFTLGQNGTTLYFVVSASDGSTNGRIILHPGTMNGNGTIAWSAEQDVPYDVGVGTVPTVAVDSAGNVWTAIETVGSNGQTPSEARNIEVFKGAAGSWSEVFNLGNLADYPRPILLPLTPGKMALEVLTETPGERAAVIYTTTDGGATWSAPVSIPQGLDNILTLSSVSVGDTVYSVTSDTSGRVNLWNYTYGGSSFAGPTPLAKCCSEGYNDAVISTDGASYLFVAYSNSTSVLCESSTDLGRSWTAPAAITTIENLIQPGSLATNYLTTGRISIVWTAQSSTVSTLFDVRFASAT